MDDASSLFMSTKMCFGFVDHRLVVDITCACVLLIGICFVTLLKYLRWIFISVAIIFDRVTLYLWNQMRFICVQ
jgi:hypothetical protein